MELQKYIPRATAGSPVFHDEESLAKKMLPSQTSQTVEQDVYYNSQNGTILCLCKQKASQVDIRGSQVISYSVECLYFRAGPNTFAAMLNSVGF